MIPWELEDGTLIVDDDGAPIECDVCPCDTAAVVGGGLCSCGPSPDSWRVEFTANNPFDPTHIGCGCNDIADWIMTRVLGSGLGECVWLFDASVSGGTPFPNAQPLNSGSAILVYKPTAFPLVEWQFYLHSFENSTCGHVGRSDFTTPFPCCSAFTIPMATINPGMICALTSDCVITPIGGCT